MAAVRDSWQALWSSRLLVWLAGVGTLLAFGFGPVRNALQPARRDEGIRVARRPAGGPRRALGRLLVPGDRALRLPARPGPVHLLAHGVLPALSARPARDRVAPACRRCSPACSCRCCALALALYGIHRLTTLELTRHAPGRHPQRAGGARWLAWPCSSPRSRRWRSTSRRSTPSRSTSRCRSACSGAPATAAGRRWERSARWPARRAARASCSRLPALILYLYGPREDRAPDFPAARRWRPRYRLRRDIAVAGLVPAGLGLYMAYLAASGGDALMPFHAQDVWGRHFAGPYLGVWDGIKAALRGRAPAAVLPAPPSSTSRAPAAARSSPPGTT